MNVSQGVHDASEWNTSQRPAAESDVEPLPRNVERFSVVDCKPDAATLLTGQRLSRCRNVLGARVEGVDRGCTGSCECHQPSVAAADIEHAFPLERYERGARRRLHPSSSRRSIR